MLVVVFLGLLAVALSNPVNYVSPLFDLTDVNKDGVIQMSEWFTRYNTGDVDGDEMVNLKEFAAGSHPGSPPLTVEEAFKIFDKLDGKVDGLTNPSAAVGLFESMGGKNDGKITREEFEATFLLIFNNDNKKLLG